MEEIYIPVLSHFENGNLWTASDGRMRYLVRPEENVLTAQVWEGPWSYEFSTVEETRQFPMDAQGLDQLAQWVRTWAAAINARPVPTLEQSIARRAETVAE